MNNEFSGGLKSAKLNAGLHLLHSITNIGKNEMQGPQLSLSFILRNSFGELILCYHWEQEAQLIHRGVRLEADSKF